MSSLNRRSFLAAAALGATVAPAAVHGASTRGKGRPNILVLIADDLGDRDMGCFGHPSIRTVNLDNLAAQGVRFESSFVTISSCSPSRASFFTGLYPHATGAEDLHVPLPADRKTLAAHLGALGYFTANAGKLDLGPDGAAQFARVEEKVAAWRTVLEERPAGKPFFLAVGFTDPHRPYKPGILPDPVAPEDVIVPPYLADTPATRADLALYYDAATRMDREIGAIMQYLREKGLENDTLVLFFSDNGMPFPRAKTSCYDSGTRTPMLARWPGHFPSGAVCRSLVSTVDLAPSLLALAGGKPAPEMQGQDMSRLFVDPASAGREYVFTERNWHNRDDHIRAARDSRYKYIRNFFPREMTPLASDLMASDSYASLVELRDQGRLTPQQMRLFMVPRAAEELYDTQSDPWEFRNLAGLPQYKSHLERLRTQCEQWMQQTNDSPPAVRKRHNLDIFTRQRYGRTEGEPEDWTDWCEPE